VTVYPEPDKFGKQLKYADSIKVPYVAILGETEIAAGKVKLKDMKSGVEQMVTALEAAEVIKR
jgi:histidyl-tRNA synthetase